MLITISYNKIDFHVGGSVFVSYRPMNVLNVIDIIHAKLGRSYS